MYPKEPRIIKVVGENQKRLSWNGERISLPLTRLPSLFLLAPPSPFPLQHHQHSPPSLRTIEKQPLMRLGRVSCLPLSPHLPCFDFVRWKINHSHSIPSHCPQGAETSPLPWSLPATWDCQVQREKSSETHIPFGERRGSMGIIASS